ncbi:scarecrow-like protein 33 [Lolium rigidum]|uniref:scarecrow-like protein 33 n=1 Tax=Lolium rigidum TaxID=89674 RepID=UPI001F5C351D|nr:scarecrow-like protein 33 [Lolium rigidum]
MTKNHNAVQAMAATQDKLFALVEPAPLSPSLFLDCASTSHGDSQQTQDGLALAYISHMLMEEDIPVDKFFYRYPDHPMVLQAEQPFAEILSASGTTSYGFLSTEVHNPTFLNGTVTVAEEPSSSSTSIGMLSSMAFLKGMEEANRFLPTQNGFMDGRRRKNRFDDLDGETVPRMGRSSKQIVPVHTDSEKEHTTVEMSDDLLTSSGYDMYPSETMKERGDKAAQQSICRKAPRVRHGATQMMVADLETLLIRCAEAVATIDRRRAGDLLERIKRNSLPTGDATQRLAHYFAEGLEARLAGTGWQLYHSITVATHANIMEFLKGYHLYMATCCFLKVSIHFSNKNIYNAVAGRKKLHIVHYGVNDGFQWPELLRWLAEREGGPPEVRLTGIISPQPGLCPVKHAEESKHRLSHCASQLGVPFKFRAIIAKLEVIRAEDLDIDPDEVLVVNNLFHFRTLMDEGLTFDMVNPRDLVLNTVRKMKPSVFVHATINGPYSSALFKTRFHQALSNFTAQFDMMATTMPRERDSGKRLLLERKVLGRRAVNIIACEGADRVERPQNYKEWQTQNQRAGLRQLPLDRDIVEMLKDQVKEQYHRHFIVNEDGHWLLLGWKGRVLYALSTWAADDGNGSQPP